MLAQSITQRRDYFIDIQIVRYILHGTASAYLIDIFQYISNYNLYQTRLSNFSMLYVPKRRIEKFRQSFQFFGFILLNGLPKDVTTSISLHGFK
jgi:hypothetical protein